MSRRLHRSEHGFTLIEVMVAALIIVLAMTALAAVLVGAQNQASAAVQQNQLTNLADQQIDQIRAAVASQGFNSLGVALPGGESISSFVPLSSATVRKTWVDPEKFVEGSCFEIASNYDSVSTGSAAPYGTAPAGFTAWSNCNAQSEPLQIFASGALINWSTSPISQCTSGASSSITVPCWMKLSSSCSAAGTYAIGAVPACAVTVYVFVTDTYVGCFTQPNGSPAGICPTVTNGTVQVPASAPLCTTTTVSASGSCADARRVTVAIVPNGSHTLARVTPAYVSAVFTNPSPSTSQAGSIGLTAGVTL